MAKAVYIHIPFCIQKCYYCDFNSYALKGQPVQDYLQALSVEMSLITAKNPPEKIKSIFIGGGTPTVLTAEQLEMLFIALLQYFPNWEADIEFTVEANPGTLSEEKLKVMRQYGVNRLSIGVQSFQNELLKFIGRIHSVEDVYHSIAAARKSGFNNISIDLMFGLPKQTIAMFQDSLKKALELDLPHISVYSLKVEEDTPFYLSYEKNALPLPDEDEELKMYLQAISELSNNNLKQYEISNFAKDGYLSRHNINYWENKEYYGLGAGAHGYLANGRIENIKDVKQYTDSLLQKQLLPLVAEYQVPLMEKMENTMMLGLRMNKGVSLENFFAEYKIDLREKYRRQIERLSGTGLIVLDDQGLRLTSKGVIFGNEVFAEFLNLGN